MLEELGKNVHMIGIGGARLSALARILAAHGYHVTGSDTSESSFIKNLRRQGIDIAIGHDARHVADAGWVAYTRAVGESNPELSEARRRGLPVYEGAELLGLMMEGAGKAIAVSGTHGKTTTTAMIALAMIEGQADPSIVIGGEIDALGGNARSGGREYFLTEACEFKGAFLHLRPDVAVVTNVDWDHPDCYPDIESVIEAFRKFVFRLPGDGRLVTFGDDPNACAVAETAPCPVVTYGMRENNAIRAVNVSPAPHLGQTYDLWIDGRPTARVELAVPGPHNVQNSLACLAVCRTIGLPLEPAIRALARFNGVHRRFEVKGESGGVLIVDDYAHHPSAVRATLRTAREHFDGRLWCVFQPHLFSRTRHLFHEFARSFDEADNVVLADIYPAREADPGDISSAMLADEIRKNHSNVHYFGGLDKVLTRLLPLLAPGDLVITMGAGDVTYLGDRLLNALAAPNFRTGGK